MMNFRNEWEPKSSNEPISSKTFGTVTPNHNTVNNPNNLNNPNLAPPKSKSSSIGGTILVIVLYFLFRLAIKECKNSYSDSYKSYNYPTYNSNSLDKGHSNQHNIIKETMIQKKSPDEELKKYVEEMKKTLPDTIEEGITLTDMFLTKYYIVAVYTVDENLYDMDLISLDKEEIQQDRIKEFREDRKNNKDTEDFINVLLETKRNIRYSYKGNKTKKTVDVDIITATI